GAFALDAKIVDGAVFGHGLGSTIIELSYGSAEMIGRGRGEGGMRRRDLLGLAGAFAVGGAAVRHRAMAQEKKALKASDVHPEGYPTVQAVENMGKKLEQATGGRLSIQMYASMQLGGEKEAIEQAQVGALQLARVSVGALGPVVDDLNVFNLPFLFRDTAHME